MKTIPCPGIRTSIRGVIIGIVALLSAVVPAAHAGLTFTLDIYTQNEGSGYVFYTPMVTNAISPAAPQGSYFISSPQWPTNGCTRGYQMTASGLSDIEGADQENGYSDISSTLQQITNGFWTILYTNNTATNLYRFKVNAGSLPANLLPPVLITFPADGSVILSDQTNFTWQGPTNWAVHGDVETYNDSYYQYASLPASQTNWIVDTSIPVGTNYSFYLHYETNYANPVLVASTPLNTNGLVPIAMGWASSNVLESGSSGSYVVVSAYGTAYQGHTLLAHYTFEDNNLFVHDFSGNGNDMSYAWFTVPPTIVTNHAAAGKYAGGFGGSGWFTPPSNLQTLFAGSFSVSLWLQTTNVYGNNNEGLYSAAGIVSDLGSDYNTSAMPMGQTGSKLAFYTGGGSQNLLQSQANITNSQYIHLVTTRDQQTGEKRIYINGVLDASLHVGTDLLTGTSDGDLTIGYNNGNVFTGVMDEIEFYSGVLSSNDVAFLHSHPGTNVADTLELNVPLARYDFEDTNNPGTDSSGHNNSTSCSTDNGIPEYDTFSTNAAIGNYARQFFGDTSICFNQGDSTYYNISNALGGSFTLTAWVNTTNSVNYNFANAYFGSPILFDYADSTNQMAFSITGGNAAFTVGNPNGGQDTTLHSTNAVNDGNYHFLAATRDAASGVMNLYVDGQLEATGISTNGLRHLNATLYLAGSYYTNYAGLLDDVRIYAAPLPQNDIAQLYGESPTTLGGALNAPQLTWTTSGDTAWFIENTNTYDGLAVQSGIVTNEQTSVLSTTVTGPGTLTFYWASQINNEADFDYEFDIDGSYADDLYYSSGWFQELDPGTGLPYVISSGTHTLTWRVSAYGDNDPSEAGYLDDVSFVPNGPVSLTSPLTVGTNFQFAFQSQVGFSYNIEYSTNLVSGNWQTWSNFTGDGTLKNYAVPFSVFTKAKQGFMRVSTQ